MSDYPQGNYPPPMPGYQRRVSFSEAIKMGFNKYATFSGRSSRSEYWWWTLFTIILAIVASFLDKIFGTEIIIGEIYGEPEIVGIISLLASLAFIIPGLAIVWRRLHDIGRAGGWIFISLIPIIGSLILLYWEIQDSEMYPNRFGSVPNWVGK